MPDGKHHRRNARNDLPSAQDLRVVDIDIAFNAQTKVEIRRHQGKASSPSHRDSAAADKGSGKMVNAQGRSARSKSGQAIGVVDYSGTIGEEKVGIAIFDHPSNLKHPVRLARARLRPVAANPFGSPNLKAPKAADAVRPRPRSISRDSRRTDSENFATASSFIRATPSRPESPLYADWIKGKRP